MSKRTRSVLIADREEHDDKSKRFRERRKQEVENLRAAINNLAFQNDDLQAVNAKLVTQNEELRNQIKMMIETFLLFSKRDGSEDILTLLKSYVQLQEEAKTLISSFSEIVSHFSGNKFIDYAKLHCNE
jgi:predicted nucleotide-binding protein (sugar kinase/HSP70/actin superfamily)